MPIKRILKILGYIFVPLLLMVVAIYFLFPYLNEEKHKKTADKYSKDFVIGDTTETNVEVASLLETESSGDVEDLGEDFSDLKEKNNEFQQNIEALKKQIDSLTTVNDSLEQQLADGGEQGQTEADEQDSEITEEEFAENIKSLLDLDVENLSPILSNMDDEKLEQIYRAASGLQRKKLLRSMESDRAAKLMTEVL